MRILADENIDLEIVEQLRGAGLEVAYIAELAPGIEDDEVLSLNLHTGSLLLTADKDFGNLVFQLRRANAGVLLLRLHGMTPRAKAHMVLQVIQETGPRLTGSFSVLSRRQLRVRPRSS